MDFVTCALRHKYPRFYQELCFYLYGFVGPLNCALAEFTPLEKGAASARTQIMMEQQIGKFKIVCGEKHNGTRRTLVCRLDERSSSVFLQGRQFGRRCDQQRQVVGDSNREIETFLSTAGFTCCSMTRGIGKQLVCLRKTRRTRDE